jgi:hypothetical protein
VSVLCGRLFMDISNYPCVITLNSLSDNVIQADWFGAEQFVDQL